MPKETEYNRQKAVEYAAKWAYARNPRYFDFHEMGGDCTNFISQCLYAGSGIMNYTPGTGWFYNSPSSRAPAWTGVPFLRQFLVRNRSVGPFAVETDISQMLPGDIIQLGDENNRYYHSLLVVAVNGAPSRESIQVATHTFDAYGRYLNTYSITNIRFLHISGVRRW